MEGIPFEIKDKYYLAAICATGGLTRIKVLLALEKLGSAKAVFEAEDVELIQLGFTNKQIELFLSKRSLDKPKSILRFCEREGVQLITIRSQEYPASLKNIVDPPLVLYVKGSLSKESYAVAIVGSREASEYGQQAAKYFSGALAKVGIPIISGGAKGIDTVAHRACLEAGGKTIAVLGCGIDIVYPEINRQLFRRIAENGAIITEFAPGTKPIAYNFPARNRIVVGLSQAVVVAEAKRKSGAIITAHIAADEGRDVYCIPGNIFSGNSLGCHDLIRKGAKPVDRIEDILEDIPEWQKTFANKTVTQNIFDFMTSEEEQKKARTSQEEKQKVQQLELQAIKQQKLQQQSEIAQRIYSCLENKTLSLDEIIEISGEDLMRVSMAILNLQVVGLIEETGIQLYHHV